MLSPLAHLSIGRMLHGGPIREPLAACRGASERWLSGAAYIAELRLPGTVLSMELARKLSALMEAMQGFSMASLDVSCCSLPAAESGACTAPLAHALPTPDWKREDRQSDAFVLICVAGSMILTEMLHKAQLARLDISHVPGFFLPQAGVPDACSATRHTTPSVPASCSAPNR